MVAIIQPAFIFTHTEQPLHELKNLVNLFTSLAACMQWEHPASNGPDLGNGVPCLINGPYNVKP